MTDFARTRALFHLPEGVIYLDGNSLGPLPRAALAAVTRTLEEEWGQELIRAWNTRGWIGKPRGLGDRIARLIGAPPGTVVVGDTLSIKVFQALAAALALNPDRRVILSDNGNFPTDLYMAQGLVTLLDRGYTLRTPAPEDVEAAIADDVAVLMLTEVDYRTGRLHDMGPLIAKAHAAGALVIWDLAHSAGALPVDVAGLDTDFAVGCTYKYLNGGPGAPAFIYVAPRLADHVQPVLSGWLGHDAPFAFELGYRPAAGIERMRVGTPPLLAYAALEAALEAWDGVDMADVRARSIAALRALHRRGRGPLPRPRPRQPPRPQPPRQPGLLPLPARLRRHAGAHRPRRHRRLPRPRHHALRLHPALPRRGRRRPRRRGDGGRDAPPPLGRPRLPPRLRRDLNRAGG